MKKAMKQVLGDIDERKTAAQDQKLQQNRSVRENIGKLRPTTLNWDDVFLVGFAAIAT